MNNENKNFSLEKLQKIENENRRLKKELDELKYSFKSDNYIGKLIESADQLRKLLNAAPEIVCFKDKDGKLIEANDAYLDLFDLKGKDYRGKSCDELAKLSPHFIKFFSKCSEADKEIWTAKTTIRNEIVFQLQDGSEKNIDLIRIPIFYFDGKPKGIVLLGRDITSSKQTEVDLRKSEEKYRLLFETNLAGVYRTSIEGKILDCNESFANMLGYKTTADLLKVNAYDLYFTRAARDLYINELKEKGYLSAHELLLKKKDGNAVWIIENVTLFENILLGTTINITEKKRTEELIREYDFIVNASQDFMTLISKDYRYAAVSDSYCKAQNLSRVDIIGRKVSEIWGTDSFKEIIKENLDLCLKGKVVNYQSWFMMPLVGPRYFDVTYSPYYDLKGNVSNVAVVSRDITDRKKHEDDLRKSEERFRILFENNPLMVFLINPDGIILNVNQNGSKELNFTIEELIGKQITDITLLDDRKIISEHIKKCLHSPEEKFQCEIRKVKSDENIIWARVTASVVRSQINEPLILLVSENITEKRKNEEEIHRYSEELKELNASKDKFFSIVAHDLKSPFQGLLGYSSILVEEMETLSKDEIKFFTNNINKITKNTFKLVENLLEWSRLQLGKLEYQPIKVNLFDTIQEVFNMLVGNAIKKDISLVNEVNQNVLIKADGKMIQSILNNIVSNGIKFTHNGGKIIVSSTDKNDFVEINIADDGIGIPKEDIDKLFRIDVNVSTKGTSDEQGTGLGLVLCKELVEKHGGNISVSSEINKGTMISFTMPKYF